MPSDKCDSIVAIATDLISSLLNVALSWDVPFHKLQLLQCLHYGFIKATFVLLCTPFHTPLQRMWQFVVCALWLRCLSLKEVSYVAMNFGGACLNKMSFDLHKYEVITTYVYNQYACAVPISEILQTICQVGILQYSSAPSHTFQTHLARVPAAPPSGEKGAWHSHTSCCSFIARFCACTDASRVNRRRILHAFQTRSDITL